MKHLLLILLLIPSFVQAETFWVRPKNSLTCQTTCAGLSYADAFNGISDISWGSGAGQVGPGDTLRICGDFDRTTEGRTNLIDVNTSGTSGNPITITGDCPEGAQGRLWGSRRIDTNAWTNAGSGAYYIAWTYVMENAAEGAFGSEVLLENKSSLAEVQATPGSIWRDVANNRLYYRPLTTLKTVWANWTSAIATHGSDYLIITDLVMRGGRSGEHATIELTGNAGAGPAEHITISNSNIAFGTWQLIECYSGCDHLTVENNVFHDAPVATYLCRGAVDCVDITTRNNQVYSGRDLANLYDATEADRHALGGQNISDSLFEHNHIHDWAGDGIFIWVKTGLHAENNVIRFNIIERLDDADGQNYHRGIALSGDNEVNRGDSTSGWQVYGNVIRDLEGSKSATDEGAAIRVKAAVATDGTRHQIYGNTITDVGYGVWLREIVGDYRLGATIRDNTISNAEKYIAADYASDGSLIDIDIDHNRYFGSGQFTYRATTGDLATWQAALGGCPRVKNDCKSSLSASQPHAGVHAQCVESP